MYACGWTRAVNHGFRLRALQDSLSPGPAITSPFLGSSMDFNCALFGCTVQVYWAILRYAQPSDAERPLQHSEQLCSSISQVPRCQKDASVAQGHLPGDLRDATLALCPAVPARDKILDTICDLGYKLCSFLRGLWLALCLALIRLLVVALPQLVPKPIRRLTKASSNPQVLRPLEVLTGRQDALDWTPYKDRKGRPARTKHKATSSPFGPLGRLVGFFVPLALPVPVNPFLPCLPAVCIHFLPGAYAMARPPHPDDPPGVVAGQGRPHLLPPEQLTTFVGSCDVSPIWGDSQGNHRLPGDFLDLSGPLPQADEYNDGSWLGVYLYTPHYQTLTWSSHRKGPCGQSLT